MEGALQLVEGCTPDEFLTALCREREVYTLNAGQGGQFHLVRADRWKAEEHRLGPYRPVEPLKTLLFPPREHYGPLFEPPPGAPAQAERIVLGVKNCDLAALKIHDHQFLDMPPPDPRYAEARAKTLLVSCDCTDSLDDCFCPVVGQQPYAETGYDINLSPVDKQLVIEVGSDRGAVLIKQVQHLLAPASPRTLEKRTTQRAALLQQVKQQAAGHGLHPGMDLTGAIRGSTDSPLWEDFAVDCVECGACNFTCCTCHCFLLADGAGPKARAQRGRQWDSCLMKNFARVAGGANPRTRRAARLRNRFEKKFVYFPDVLDHIACDGCGRCTEACAGHIDIRDVLRRAHDEATSIPAGVGHH